MNFVGVSYGRGGQKKPIDFGCENGPIEIQKLYPNHNWDIISPTWKFDEEECEKDRFTENFKIQKMIYDFFENKDENFIKNHIFLGGDHSVNFAHFKAIADKFASDDIALIYLDAHFDIHTPLSSKQEASGSPHGTNVRHLLGEGDERYINLGKIKHPLKKENLFYIGPRSYEPSEFEFVKCEHIFLSDKHEINNEEYLIETAKKIMEKIGNKKYVISIDFDILDPNEFCAVQVPEENGMKIEIFKKILPIFKGENLISTELVEFAPSFDILGNANSNVKDIIDIFLK